MAHFVHDNASRQEVERPAATEIAESYAATLEEERLVDDSYRTFSEFNAKEGDVLLRMHSAWAPPDDCQSMSVPEMIMHIYRFRKGHAVAPNGHTTPFLSVEEWSRIADWAKEIMQRGK